MSDILEKRNRVDIRFNGEVILGVSLNCERPKNSNEIRDILKDLVNFLDAPIVEDDRVL